MAAKNPNSRSASDKLFLALAALAIFAAGANYLRHWVYNRIAGPFPMTLEQVQNGDHETGFLHRYYVSIPFEKIENTGFFITDSTSGKNKEERSRNILLGVKGNYSIAILDSMNKIAWKPATLTGVLTGDAYGMHQQVSEMAAAMYSKTTFLDPVFNLEPDWNKKYLWAVVVLLVVDLIMGFYWLISAVLNRGK